MRKHIFVMFSILVVSLIWTGFVCQSVASRVPVLYVDPPSIIDVAEEAGTKFVINVNIRDVTDLFTFDFRLNYSTSILDVTASHLGSFFPSDSFIAVNDTDRAAGSVRFLVSQPFSTQKGIDGSGTLISFDFKVLSTGFSRLSLLKGSETAEAWAWDSNHNIINVKVFDGYFRNTSGPKIYVHPQNVTDPNLVQGQTFAINVSVSEVADLHQAVFNLSYDSSLLNVTDIVEGDFLKGGGSTEFSFNVNRTLGDLHVNTTIAEPGSVVAGSGTLAKITFGVTGLGECLLYLHNTRLIHTDMTPIEHAAVEGLFNNNPLVHDVAIIKVATTVSETQIVQNVSMTVSKPVSSIESGKHVNVAVTIKNFGSMPETVDVTAYYDDTQIGQENGTSIARGASTTLTFDWNTQGVGAGNHTIWAEARSVAGETNTANNKFIMDSDFVVSSGGLSVPLVLIAAIGVGVVVVLMVAVYFFKFRKPRSDVT